MKEKVTDALKKTNLPDRQQKLLAMFPGCMFGFPPPYFKEMMERLDCPTCQEILGIVERMLGIYDRLGKQINECCQPTYKRNNSRREKFEARRRIPIFGRFFSTPTYEPEPDYKSEPWYVQINKEIAEVRVLYQDLRRLDKEHWHGETNKEINDYFLSAFLKERYMFYRSIFCE